MINETMYARGAESSIIREIFSYGLERKAQSRCGERIRFFAGQPERSGAFSMATWRISGVTSQVTPPAMAAISR